MTNLKTLFKYLKEKGVVFEENGEILNHWALPKKDLRLKQEVLRAIFGYLGQPEVRYSYYVVEKNKNSHCGDQLCVHPDCHTVKLKKSSDNKAVTVETLTVDDIIEIAEEIDIELYYELGSKKFLEKYNDTQPDFLKINENQLKAVIKYVENKND